jgi:hypothetical protein
MCRAEFHRNRLDSFDPDTDVGTLSQFCIFFYTRVQWIVENKVVNVWIELARYMSTVFCIVTDKFCLYLDWLRRLGCVH